MKLTQKQIANHLGLSQKSVSVFLQQAGIDLRTSTIDEVRFAYLQKLTDQAAMYRSDDGNDLVHERVLTERVYRELKEFALAEKKSQLINVAQLEPEMMQMVGVFRSHLLACDDKLKSDFDALYGTDIDIKVLNGYTLSALAHLARYDLSTNSTTT